MVLALHPLPRRRAATTAVAALAIGLSLAGCATTAPGTADEAAPQTPNDTFGHIHGLGVDSTSGAAFVASHNGVFGLPPLGSAPIASADLGGPIGGRAQDTMGFTMDGTEMFGSGHPDPADQSSPPNLGFITSADSAQTWATISLGGEKDFHDVEVVRKATGTLEVWAVDSSNSRIMSSLDGGKSWESGADVPVRDVAVDPVTNTLYGTSEQGLAVSSDGGTTFEVDPEAPLLYLIDWVDDPSSEGLIGIDLSGTVWTRLGAEKWTKSGAVEGDVQAMTYSASPDQVLLVADARGIVASDDFGSTWRVVVTP